MEGTRVADYQFFTLLAYANYVSSMLSPPWLQMPLLVSGSVCFLVVAVDVLLRIISSLREWRESKQDSPVPDEIPR